MSYWDELAWTCPKCRTVFFWLIDDLLDPVGAWHECECGAVLRGQIVVTVTVEEDKEDGDET